jgi:bacillithiol biosynthesis cysteine-adding enzyme BshC
MHYFSYTVEETTFISAQVKDYLNDDPFLRSFYGEYPDMAGILKQVQRRKEFPVDRELLADVLKVQYQNISDVDNSVLNNIEKLRSSDTYTVTTGHQLNVLTGPLFSVYKILTTIKLAQMISSEINCTVVPVFWMASEDHDIDEIDHLYYKNNKYSCDFATAGPTGRLSSEPVLQLIDLIKEEHPELVYNDLLEIFRNAYSECNTLSAATRCIMNRLFGKYGLVIIDADDRTLKAEFAGEMSSEIIRHTTFNAAEETGKVLGERYKLLVNPRKVNLFFMDHNGRFRINDEGAEELTLVDSDLKFTRNELTELLNKEPERFSPNVILRTVYQEKILPNLCYIGGPGEVSYWLQFKGVFDEFGIPFPCVLLRNSFLLLNAKLEKKYKSIGLEVADIFLERHQVERKILERSGEIFDELAFHNKLEEMFKPLRTDALKLDPTLKFPVEGELKKAKDSVTKLRKKFLRSLKRKEQTAMERIQYLFDELFPSGSMQERTANILNFMNSADDDLMRYLYEITDPMDQDIKVVFYE